MKTKYAFQGLKENMARAISKDLGISSKVSIEIANFLRGRTSAEAKVILERVLKKKQPIPFKRFTDGVGHRKGAGLAAGRFPQKASEAFLTIIKQCEANAQAKGLSSDLRIVHLVVQRGTNMFRHGRQRRRMYKRTHLEIVLEEFESGDKDSKSSKKAPVSKPKAESKKDEKKDEKKDVAPKKEEKKEEPKKEVKKEEPKKEVKKEEPKKEEKKEEPKKEAPKKEQSKKEEKKDELKKEEPKKAPVSDDDSKNIKNDESLPNQDQKVVDDKSVEDKK